MTDPQNTSGAEPHLGQWPAHPAERGQPVAQQNNGLITTVPVRITQAKPIEGLADKVIGRAWNIDGVTFAEAAPPYAPLTEAEMRDLSAMVWGAPAADDWVKSVGLPLIQQYEKLRAAGQRPVDPATLPACQMCGGSGLVGGNMGQTPENFSLETHPCPACNDFGGVAINDLQRIQADIDRAHAEEVRLGMHDVGGVA